MARPAVPRLALTLHIRPHKGKIIPVWIVKRQSFHMKQMWSTEDFRSERVHFSGGIISERVPLYGWHSKKRQLGGQYERNRTVRNNANIKQNRALILNITSGSNSNNSSIASVGYVVWSGEQTTRRHGDPEWECGEMRGRNPLILSCSQLPCLLTSHPRDGCGRWSNVAIQTNAIISALHSASFAVSTPI